jgi:hypothetical protein
MRVRVNPAAGLIKPRRTRSRRRALDDAELAELIDAVRPARMSASSPCVVSPQRSSPRRRHSSGGLIVRRREWPRLRWGSLH